MEDAATLISNQPKGRLSFFFAVVRPTDWYFQSYNEDFDQLNKSLFLFTHLGGLSNRKADGDVPSKLKEKLQEYMDPGITGFEILGCSAVGICRREKGLLYHIPSWLRQISVAMNI